MPAFGPTDAFKEAAGFNREYANWSFQQFKDWLDRANQSGAISERLRQQVEEYLQEQIRNGFASPEDIGQIASRIIPGLEDAISRRQGRLNDIQELWNQRTPSGETIGQLFENSNQEGVDISRGQEMNQSEIDNLANRQFGREEEASNEVRQNIGQSYGGFRSGVDDTFGAARRNNARVSQNILNSNTDAFGRLRTDNTNTASTLRRLSGETTGGLNESDDALMRRLNARRSGVYGETRGALEGTIGGLESGTRETYNPLIQRAGERYGQLGESGEETFNESLKSLESMGPAGDAIAARLARSMAPARAQTAENLRRAGIGPNDPQYASVMAAVDADIAAKMDDARATAAMQTVDRANAVRSERQGMRERLAERELGSTERLSTAMRTALNNLGLTRFEELRNLNLGELDDETRQQVDRELRRQGLTINDLERQIQLEGRRQTNEANLTVDEQDRGRSILEGELNRENQLSIDQSDRSIALGREEGQLSRGEILRRLSANQGIDEARGNASIRTNDQAFQRTQDWRRNNDQIQVLKRAMEREDFETAANLMREMNGEEITALNLRQMAYDKGLDWVINNYQRRDAGAGNLANMYAREQQNQQGAARTAVDFGEQASGNYARTYQQESGKGGWGTRLITGAAQMVAGAIPGVGPILATGMGMARNSMQQPQQGGYGTPAQGGASAYGGGWQQPVYARTPPYVQPQQQSGGNGGWWGQFYNNLKDQTYSGYGN